MPPLNNMSVITFQYLRIQARKTSIIVIYLTHALWVDIPSLIIGDNLILESKRGMRPAWLRLIEFGAVKAFDRQTKNHLGSSLRHRLKINLAAKFFN